MHAQDDGGWRQMETSWVRFLARFGLLHSALIKHVVYLQMALNNKYKKITFFLLQLKKWVRGQFGASLLFLFSLFFDNSFFK